jgi:hypothetical protein
MFAFTWLSNVYPLAGKYHVLGVHEHIMKMKSTNAKRRYFVLVEPIEYMRIAG